MAIKKSTICDACKHLNKQENNAWVSFKVDAGDYLDYDRTKTDYRLLDLCADHAVSLIDKLLEFVPRQKQSELYKAYGGSLNSGR